MALKVKIEKALLQEVAKNEFKVLILEESAFVRKALKANLIKLGFHEKNLYETDNGEDGFAFLMEIEGVDFIIVDLAIPRISGIDFIQSVKKNSSYKHVHVIAMDKEDTIDENSIYLHKFGVYDVIAKPFTQDEFFNLFVPKLQKLVGYKSEKDREKERIKAKEIKKEEEKIEESPKSQEVESKETKDDKSEKIISDLRDRVENLESELHHIHEERKIDIHTKLLSHFGLMEALNDYERLFEKFKERQNYMLVAFRMDKLEVLYLNFGEAMINTIAKTYSNILKKYVIGDNVSSYVGNGKFIIVISVQEDKEIAKKVEFAKKLVVALKSQKINLKEKQIALTFSCGIALRSKSGSIKNTIAKVDEKLRSAIKKGGNKIEV